MEGMKKSAILCAAALLACIPAQATEEAMNKALATWEQQNSEYQAALRMAATPETRAKITAPDGADVAQALWKAVSKAKTATREGKDGKQEEVTTYEFEEPWAVPAVVWFVEHPQALARVAADKKGKGRTVSYYAEKLMDALHRKHFADPRIAPVCAKLAEGSTPKEYEILEKIYNRNQDKDARGCAAMGMSLLLCNPLIASIGGSEAEVRAKRVYYLKQSLLLTRDDTMFGSARLSEVASEQAYRLRYLMPGCIPPQMTLKDMNGKVAKLPVKGKPHLLLFWSPEEETGTEIVRKIDKLAEANPGVVLVPVTHFCTPDAITRLHEETGIPFTYMDDEKGTAAAAYRISSLPTAMLLGENCSILYSGSPDMQLQAKIDELTRKEKAAQKAAKPKVIVEGDPTPAKPKAPAAGKDTAPPLREMPEFNSPVRKPAK